MPQYDLRYFRVAEYQYDKETGTVSYGTAASAGEAMAADLSLKFAEGRLYAEGRLAEYLKLPTGGTISLGVKYLPTEVQKLLYGATAKTRTVGTEQVESLAFATKNEAKYVGVSFFAPDMIDTKTRYTCVFVSKALFGPPSMNLATKGDSLSFKTPTTTGEFLADDSTGELLMEVAVVDSFDAAKAWCDLVLGGAA